MKIRILDDFICEIASISNCLGLLSEIVGDEYIATENNRVAVQEALYSLKQHLDRVCDALDDVYVEAARMGAKK